MAHIQEYVPKKSRHCNPYCINNPNYKPKLNCISGRITDPFQQRDKSTIIRDMSLVCCLSSLATPVPLSFQTPRFFCAAACPWSAAFRCHYHIKHRDSFELPNVLFSNQLMTPSSSLKMSYSHRFDDVKKSKQKSKDVDQWPEQQDGPESPRAISITLSSHLKIKPSPFPPNPLEERQSSHRNLSPFVLSYHHIKMHYSVQYPISGWFPIGIRSG